MSTNTQPPTDAEIIALAEETHTGEPGQALNRDQIDLVGRWVRQFKYFD